MTLSRRKMLSVVGGGTILAAVGAGAGFLGTRTPHVAQAPWLAAGGYDDPRKNALSFGLLAPNPHNLQPWEVRLEGTDGFTLLHNRAQRLPQTDPFDRQIMIGFGCFLESMQLAAGAAGYLTDIKLFPEGEDAEAVAHVALRAGGAADPLSAHLLARRSCKKPFEARALPPQVAQDLRGFADIYDDTETVSALRDLTFEAWLTETRTPRTMRESVDLMRFGKAAINAQPDGLSMGGALNETLILTGIMTPEALMDQNSSVFQQGIEIYRTLMHATPAYAVLTSVTNTRRDQIEVGCKWMRLNLKTTSLGLGLHPVSQALQEYPEMAEHYATAHDLVAPRGHTVQMLGRVGYGPLIPRTPRWPLEQKLID